MDKLKFKKGDKVIPNSSKGGFEGQIGAEYFIVEVSTVNAGYGNQPYSLGKTPRNAINCGWVFEDQIERVNSINLSTIYGENDVCDN